MFEKTKKSVYFNHNLKNVYSYFYMNPLEVVGCGSDTQLQVGENLNNITCAARAIYNYKLQIQSNVTEIA